MIGEILSPPPVEYDGERQEKECVDLFFFLVDRQGHKKNRNHSLPLAPFSLIYENYIIGKENFQGNHVRSVGKNNFRLFVKVRAACKSHPPPMFTGVVMMSVSLEFGWWGGKVLDPLSLPRGFGFNLDSHCQMYRPVY